MLAGGRCIGVLGTPHGEDSRLQRDVAATGALISEYPPGTVTQKFFFRINRLIYIQNFCNVGCADNFMPETGFLFVIHRLIHRCSPYQRIHHFFIINIQMFPLGIHFVEYILTDIVGYVPGMQNSVCICSGYFSILKVKLFICLIFHFSSLVGID